MLPKWITLARATTFDLVLIVKGSARIGSLRLMVAKSLFSLYVFISWSGFWTPIWRILGPKAKAQWWCDHTGGGFWTAGRWRSKKKTTSEQVCTTRGGGYYTKVPTPDFHGRAGGNPLRYPWCRVFGREAKSFANQHKQEAPNPTVLPLESLSLPCLILRCPAYGFQII